MLPPEENPRDGARGRGGDNIARLIALFMDDLLRVPGTRKRFGLNPFLDLVPGVGDGAAAVISAMTLFVAMRKRIPKMVIAQMALNIILNAAIGIIPGIGEAFAFWFRPSHRNYKLLLKHERSAATGYPHSTWGNTLFVVVVLSAVLLVFAGCVLLGAYVIVLLARALFGKG